MFYKTGTLLKQQFFFLSSLQFSTVPLALPGGPPWGHSSHFENHWNRQ